MRVIHVHVWSTDTLQCFFSQISFCFPLRQTRIQYSSVDPICDVIFMYSHIVTDKLHTVYNINNIKYSNNKVHCTVLSLPHSLSLSFSLSPFWRFNQISQERTEQWKDIMYQGMREQCKSGFLYPPKGQKNKQKHAAHILQLFFTQQQTTDNWKCSYVNPGYGEWQHVQPWSWKRKSLVYFVVVLWVADACVEKLSLACAMYTSSLELDQISNFLLSPFTFSVMPTALICNTKWKFHSAWQTDLHKIKPRKYCCWTMSASFWCPLRYYNSLRKIQGPR